MRINSLIFMLSFLLSACVGSEKKTEPFANCKYGQPIAIFNPAIPSLANHQFVLESTASTESLLFKDGLELTLIQSGCDDRVQEFQFKLKGKYQDRTNTFWVEKTLDLLQKLGRLGPDYQVFNAWAEALSLQSDQILLGQSIEVQPGFFVRIDKILSQEHAILLLILSEKP